MKQDSMVERCDAGVRRRQSRALGLFALLNAVLLSVAVTTDQSSFRYVAASFADKLLHDYWVVAETCFVYLVAYLIGRQLISFGTRFGYIIAITLVASVSVIWYCDRLARISLQDGLFSSAVIHQLIAFAPFVGDYTTSGTFAKIGSSCIAFFVVQFALLMIARHLGNAPESTTKFSNWFRQRRVVTILSVAGILLLLLSLRSPTHATQVFRAHPQQHPLCMFGLVDLLMPPRSVIDETDRIQIESRLRESARQLVLLEDHYKNIRIDKPATQPPDIVLIMAESMRHDAIQMPHAPNLCQFREQALTSAEHYSGGNATEYGMFTLLTGLDPALMSRARHWPTAFPKLMKQAGYFTAFFGSGPYDWMGMSDFVRPEDWDIYHDEQDVFPFYVRDEGHVRHIDALLERRREASGHEGPVCVFFCPYTTHWDYHSSPEDEIHKPSLKGHLWWPPDPNKDLRGLKNRYLNSVHALDRVIKPLLSSEHVVIFVGDHGEAMFDYGKQLVHANSLSPAQTRTPLIVGIPGAAPRNIDQPTSHCDILPTLIDVIGEPINHSELFCGTSLLAPRPAERRFMLFNGKTKACGLFAPYAKSGNTLNMVQCSKLDLWDATVGEATVHEESGEFKQTLGGIKESFLRDFDLWLRANLYPKIED